MDGGINGEEEPVALFGFFTFFDRKMSGFRTYGMACLLEAGSGTTDEPAIGGQAGKPAPRKDAAPHEIRADMREPATACSVRRVLWCLVPAMTYFPRLLPSIIGVKGLTTVFGMGTGMAPSLLSPGKVFRAVAR